MNFEEPLKDYVRAVQSIKVSLWAFCCCSCVLCLVFYWFEIIYLYVLSNLGELLQCPEKENHLDKWIQTYTILRKGKRLWCLLVVICESCFIYLFITFLFIIIIKSQALAPLFLQQATLVDRASAFKQQCELAETIKFKEIDLWVSVNCH